MKILLSTLILILSALIGLATILGSSKEAKLKGGTNSDVVAALATSTQVTVNTTSTQVFSRGSVNGTLYRSISLGTSTAAVTCVADDLAAASSLVGSGGGITLSSSTNLTLLQFGRCPNCIPVYGAINCIAPLGATNVKVTETGSQ